MASTDEEATGGRRTRSGRTVSATLLSPVASVRASRKRGKSRASITLAEDAEPTENAETEAPSVINEMLKEVTEEAAVLEESENDENRNEVMENNGMDAHDDVIAEEVVIEEVVISDEGENCITADKDDDDCIMFGEEEQEQDFNADGNAGNVSAIDEKSSSFPFGNVVPSETSEDAPNEECEENKTQAEIAESSLMASLAGDNANSLPSVGGGDDTYAGKKDEFDEKLLHAAHEDLDDLADKTTSSDSISEPAIAEDLPVDGSVGSSATIVNMEIISEDELPMPTKPEINDAEEVSDEELPAPERAELPADAEVISEDELPSSATDKPSPKIKESVPAAGQKRKAEPESTEVLQEDNKEVKGEEDDEKYNPMSPTNESNELPPLEKKQKTEDTVVENKEKKKTDSKQKEKEKEKDKEKEKEKEKAKEKKRLPELDKYWRAVKEESSDFTGWTYLLQYVDNESDAEAAREAYDAFLAQYPYCYGYWRKYADYEKRKGIKANSNTVFERGLEAIPLSVDLWIHYLMHVKANEGEKEDYVRSQFERAIDACGLEFRSDKLWDAYIKWESDAKRYVRVVQIYDRLLTVPTQGYNGHFDNFQDVINQHPVTSTITPEELNRLVTELRESKAAAKSKSRSRSLSKDKDAKSSDKDAKHKQEQETAHSIDADKEAHASEDVEMDNDEERTTAKEPSSSSSELTDHEIAAIKEKFIAVRRKLHKATVNAVTARWTYEEGIKRPYFHVKPLERCQLKNWKEYLDFEIKEGDRQRILVLFERCLIACALYDEFWLKMIRYLESIMDQPNIPAITSNVYRRACEIHQPDKPSLQLMWSAFEECRNNFDKAADILEKFDKRTPNVLQVAYRRINVERRRGDNNKCKELYEHYIKNAKNKTISGSLSIKYARFLNKICGDIDAGLNVLKQALEKDNTNARVALQMIDLALQRKDVNEEEVVEIMDKFMVREGIDPEQKVLFAQRKVEFLEDFGSTAQGLQDAQRALQLALSQANDAKRKRESSPSRKASTSGAKEGNTSQAAAYNNGTASSGSGYNYNSGNSAYYGQQSSNVYQQSYDGYYNQWQYGSGYGNYTQWSGYGNYY